MKNFSHPFFDEVYYFNSLQSSFKKAETLIKNYQVNGNFIIISKKETGSIGRDKNIWYAPEGGLWFTLGLHGFKFESSLTIFIGQIIFKTLESYINDITNLKIKWPNDIFYKNKKLAGILTYNLPFYDYYIVGIGINTNIIPKEISDITISINEIINKKINNSEFLYNFSENLFENLPDFLENGLDNVFFNQHSFLKNKIITIQTVFDTFSGISMGINKKGAILLKLPSGLIQPFYSGKIINYKNQS